MHNGVVFTNIYKMNYIVFTVWVFISLENTLYGQSIKDIVSIYYDPVSKVPFRMTSIENMLVNTAKWKNQSLTKISGLRPVELKVGVLRKVGFRSNGCTCQDFTCGCCLGINLSQFNFSREGCMNFTYDPDEFSMTMNMFMDQNTIFSSSFSAKNPPPLCIPIIIPYIPISIDTCARLYNIYTPGQNLHMCFDFETRIQQATLLVLKFDCMRIGSDGLALVKPGDNGGLPTSTTETQVDSDIYDEVTEIKYKNEQILNDEEKDY